MSSLSKRHIIVLAIVLAIGFALAPCAQPNVASEDDATASSQAATSATGEASDTQASATAGTGSECAACHSYETESLADAKLLASAHAATDCATCHTSDAIESVHASVSAPPTEDQQKALRKKSRTMGTSEYCLQCHGSLEDLAAKTAEVTIVQDTKGTIVNPHAIPVNDKHTEGGAQECYNCHWLHSKAPSYDSNCQSCHHAGVYECGTCHEVNE